MDNPRGLCFVISPIGDAETETRRRADCLLTEVIRPALEGFGYDVQRGDLLPGLQQISTQVLRSIVDAPLVVADLTGANPNVFYELALRHTVRKPVISLLQAGEQLPFDVATFRVIEVSTASPEMIGRARQAIAEKVQCWSSESLASPIAQALATWVFATANAQRIPHTVIESMVSTYLELRFLTSNFRATEQVQLSRLGEVRTAIDRLYAQLSIVTDALHIPEPHTFYDL